MCLVARLCSEAHDSLLEYVRPIGFGSEVIDSTNGIPTHDLLRFSLDVELWRSAAAEGGRLDNGLDLNAGLLIDLPQPQKGSHFAPCNAGLRPPAIALRFGARQGATEVL